MVIDSSRIKIFVPEKLLYRSNIGTVVEQMGSKRVSQGVRRRGFFDTGHRNGFAHCFRERTLVNAGQTGKQGEKGGGKRGHSTFSFGGKNLQVEVLPFCFEDREIRFLATKKIPFLSAA